MSEAYVSFETAKLLKEKGFDFGIAGKLATDDNPAICTQTAACRWLREVHNILVCVLPCEVGAGVMDYTYCIYRIICGDYFYPLAQGRIKEAMDYEKTLEAALEYVLKNLI